MIPVLTKITIKKILIFLLVILPVTFFYSLLFEETKKDTFLEQLILVISLTVFMSLSMLLIRKIIISYLKQRLLFIGKAYHLNQNKIIDSTQEQHFLDFYPLFQKYEFKRYSKVVYDNLVIQKLTFANMVLNDIQFIESKIKRLRIKNSELIKIDFCNSKIKYLNFEESKFNNIKIDNGIFILTKIQRTSLLDKYLIMNRRLLTNQFLFKETYFSKKKDFIKKYNRIIFRKIKISDFDKTSLISFQNFIKNNNIPRKYVICTSSELKDTLFAKLEGKE